MEAQLRCGRCAGAGERTGQSQRTRAFGGLRCLRDSEALGALVVEAVQRQPRLDARRVHPVLHRRRVVPRRVAAAHREVVGGPLCEVALADGDRVAAKFERASLAEDAGGPCDLTRLVVIQEGAGVRPLLRGQQLL